MFLAHCAPAPTPETETDPSLGTIQETGNLIVLTLEGPTSYRETDYGPAGFRDILTGPQGYEVELTRAFAEHMGVTPVYVVKPDVESLLEGLANGEGHIAAAGLTATSGRMSDWTFGPAYMNVTEQLVCRRNGTMPETIEDIADVSIEVVAGSSYVETLEGLREIHPDISWTTRPAGSAMPLLARVDEQKIDCTVADSNLVELARRRHFELVAALDLTDDRPLAWAVNNEVDGLQGALRVWFQEAHESGLLTSLDERWYGHFEEYDYVDVARFVRRLTERLPRFQGFFEAAAEATPFDWRVLAAQAYQESHWDPNATSPTGVRGLMMLTLPTAEEMGIRNRLDPRQSVEGGAAYLAHMYERLPEGITGEDRLWFALAAYNVGLGHIYDARDLAERRGLDKDKWDDIADTLPLLTRPEYYRDLTYGYARGYEPVHYVEKIREYYGMMQVNI
ncbi:membrane-bound lytic murein transglycosylase MltF [Maricaulis sp. CAU 1757]